MALITAASEEQYGTVAFTGGGAPKQALMELDISPRQRLDDVIRKVSNLPFGGTDCSLPMRWALSRSVSVDTFVVYTDSETWAGKVHPVQALRDYRRKTGIAAKLVVVGMVSNGFSIADPNDAGMMDVVGFDTATPNVISDFARG
jgi:60 kDa SS-A/Ro ribonucleoprotein